MKIWKIEIYDDAKEEMPTSVGILAASSEQQASDIIIKNMGGAHRVDATPMKISEIKSLPEGTIFWSEKTKGVLDN